MATIESVTVPKLTPEEQAAIDVGHHIDVPSAVAEVLDPWIADEITRARMLRDAKNDRIMKWRRTLSGVRAKDPGTRRGASNLSVPLTTWARTGVRARIDQGVWEAKPILTIQPLRGRDDVNATSNMTIANSIARLLTAEMLNPRGLNARNTMSLTGAEVVDLGTSGLKVHVTPDIIRKLRPRTPGGDPVRKVELGGVRWSYISRQNLLWCDGYGTDTQAMPFIGHEEPQAWHEMVTWGTLGYYDYDRVCDVERFYNTQPRSQATAPDAQPRTPSSATPAALLQHQIAELYMDYDVDGDGLPESVLISWHIDARVRLRTVWSPIPSGRRPILMGNFDLPADLTSADGQGVCEKCEGTQDETDMIHNIGIEAGKRGAAHIIVVAADSRAEEELGKDEDIYPGDIIVTDKPEEDVVTRPLGDPAAAQATLGLESISRDYLTRMLGLDESRLGNLEAGKRVSAQVGMTTIRESRVVIRQALGSIRMMMEEAAYITIELWRERPPAQAIASIFTPEEAAALQSVVFGASTDSMRSQFAITVNAEDAATAQETRKNELIAINQFLFTFYDRLQQLVIALASPEVAPPAKKALMLIAQRMERGVEALLNTLDSIPNPEELLVSVSEFRNILGTIASSAQPVGVDGQPSIESTDPGGGVV